MYLNKQNSEYPSSPKYAKILQITEFWLWQRSQYESVTQHSEYPRILNVAGFWICKSYTQGTLYDAALKKDECEIILKI